MDWHVMVELLCGIRELFLNAGKFTAMELSRILKPNAWPREHLLFILMVVSKVRGNGH